MQLVLSKDEVKNNVDLEFPLLARAMALIDLYMKEYQPLLCGDSESASLFPGRGGKPKCDTNLAPTDHRCCLEARGHPRQPALVSPSGGNDLPGSASRRL